jgi:Na+/H+ antiporter NhaD/arsenite permease-like protein
VWANRPPEDAFASVDWALLLFFAGLFVVVEGITKTQGAWIARLLPLVTAHSGTLPQLGLFSLASVLGSNLFSNVPFVMLLHGWLPQLPQARLLWLTLAMSSTFAGNLTLVGSVANLIVVQRARGECTLTAWDFLRVGVPSTLLTTLVGVLLLWLYSLLGWT